MSIIAHAGHSHGFDTALVAFVIVALVLGSVAAMAAVRAWQQRRDPHNDAHGPADTFADDAPRRGR